MAVENLAGEHDEAVGDVLEASSLWHRASSSCLKAHCIDGSVLHYTIVLQRYKG
jgi:hypothetical protein